MTTHNRIWAVLIVAGWLALWGTACLTDGFRHPWAPSWEFAGGRP